MASFRRSGWLRAAFGTPNRGRSRPAGHSPHHDLAVELPSTAIFLLSPCIAGAHARMMGMSRRAPPQSSWCAFPSTTLAPTFRSRRWSARRRAPTPSSTAPPRDVPRAALRALDAISRRWLAKQDSVHLAEIDAIARRSAVPAPTSCRSTTSGAAPAASAPSPDRQERAARARARLAHAGPRTRTSSPRALPAPPARS